MKRVLWTVAVLAVLGAAYLIWTVFQQLMVMM